MKIFTEKVLDIVRGIPRGKTLTYTEVALQAGNPGVVRAVESIMKKEQFPTDFQKPR